MIDIPTLLVLLATADVILAAALSIGLGGSRDGLLAWTAALAARATALGLFVAGVAPQAGTLALACGLLALSMTLQAGALLAFHRRQLPTWVHTAIIAAVAVP